MRDALSLLDQCAVMADKVTIEEVRKGLGIVGREACGNWLLRLAARIAAGPEGARRFDCAGKGVKQILTELSEYSVLCFYSVLPLIMTRFILPIRRKTQEIAPFFSEERNRGSPATLHEPWKNCDGL